MTRSECEYWLIYAIIVAGKSAKFAEQKMEALGLTKEASSIRLIGRIAGYGDLKQWLKEARTGCYGKLVRAFTDIECRDINAVTCTLDELEKIHGVGPKTARFFLMMRDPGARYAALDTHILKWLRAQGYAAPKSTPQSRKKYLELEAIFLQLADKIHLATGVTPRELDYLIWSEYSSKGTVQVSGQLAFKEEGNP